MKNMFKGTLGVFLLSIMVFSSCENDEHYDFEGNDGLVYFKEVIGSAKTPVKGEILNTPTSSFGKVEAKFPVRSTMPANGQIEVVLDVNNSLVEAYNSQYNTKHKAVDVDLLAITNKTLLISDGSYISKDSIYITIENTRFSELEAGNYLIPIQVAEVKGGMKKSSLLSNLVAYILVEVAFDNSNIKPVTVTEHDGTLVADRSAFIAEYVGPYNDYVSTTCLFDGNSKSGSDLWGEFSSNSYLTVDLGKEYTDITGVYFHHSASTYRYLETKIYSSSDKETWTLEGTAKDYNAADENILFVKNVKARYIKIQGVRCAYYNFVISEFNIFAK